MAQSHTASRAPQTSPHPGPLPRGEGESSAGSRHDRAWCLPDEPPEQPNRAVGCSLSLWVRGIGLPFDTAPRTLPEIVELRESSGRVGAFPFGLLSDFGIRNSDLQRLIDELQQLAVSLDRFELREF